MAAGIDPLTAYLATSPGGVDSVAIIAVSNPAVDVPFAMAMQTARFQAVLLAGPRLARLVPGEPAGECAPPAPRAPHRLRGGADRIAPGSWGTIGLR